MKTWTEEDIEFLKYNYQTILVKDMAKKLGRTLSSVNNRLRKLKISQSLSDKARIKLRLKGFEPLFVDKDYINNKSNILMR